MAEKELRRMSRPELIEIIYALKSMRNLCRRRMQSYDSDFRGRLYCRGCPSVERYIFYCPGRSDDYLTSIKAANVSMEEEQKAAEKEQMLNGADE